MPLSANLFLNPNASEATYKPKQRSYRKTNLKKKVLAPDSPNAQMSSAQTAAPKRTRPMISCAPTVLFALERDYLRPVWMPIKGT